MLDQPLFHNPHVRYKDKVLCFQFLIDSGIVTLSDICYVYSPGFLPLCAIIEIVHEKRYDISVTMIKNAYCVILQSLPQEWVDVITQNSSSIVNTKQNSLSFPRDDGVVFSHSLTVKFSYGVFVQNIFVPPTSVQFWDIHCLNIDWKAVWKNVFNNDKAAEQIDLDFRICHNIIFTGE